MTDRPTAERIQKRLSGVGLGSRREIERWIRAGRVKVNNTVAQLGDKVSAADRISVDDKPVRAGVHKQSAPRVIAYHKPQGEFSTRHDPQGRATVFTRLPRLQGRRWVAIGRLDVNTSGLLLFTTDGELAHRAMHPSGELTRRYAVRVFGEVPAAALKQLCSGVRLEDGMAQATRVEPAGGSGVNRWYHMGLQEGRNREVRRMWEALGFTVSRLIRIGYGPVELGRTLSRGKWRELTPGETKALYNSVGLAAPIQPNRSPSRGRGRRHGRH